MAYHNSLFCFYTVFLSNLILIGFITKSMEKYSCAAPTHKVISDIQMLPLFFMTALSSISLQAAWKKVGEEQWPTVHW